MTSINPLDEFEKFSYNAGEDDLKSDFQLIDDPLWCIRDNKEVNNKSIKSDTPTNLGDLDKSPLEQSNEFQPQHHLTNLFSKNWNELQTVSPQQVSLDWTPAQTTSDFPKTTKNTSSPATAALANFNNNDNYDNYDNFKPLFQPTDVTQQKPDLRAFNSSSGSSDEEVNLPSIQPTEPRPAATIAPEAPKAPIKGSKTTAPSKPSTSKDKNVSTNTNANANANALKGQPTTTHKRAHAETHSHSHHRTPSQPKEITPPDDNDHYSPSTSPNYQSSEEEDDDNYTSQPTRQRRRRGPAKQTSKSESVGKIHPPNDHMPYPYEVTSQGLTRCTYTSPIQPFNRCRTLFHRPYDLARHMETIHSRDEAQLVKKGEITMDQITIPGLAKALEEAEKDPKKAEKLIAVQEWKCDGKGGCGGTFSRKDALIRHRRLRGHGVPKQT
ncbi:hypothetical protein E3Q00_00339 [Wallemia mellicola]|nr:hypothetical protein E3Q00_00339 [Wallemia mellicola]